MARFERDGVSFDVPDDWREVSIISVNKPIDSSVPDVCNCLVSLEPLGESETIATRVRTKLMTLARQLPDFLYIETRDSTLAGRPATFMSFKWGPGDAQQLQRVTAVECVSPTGRAALIVSAAASMVNEADHWRDLDALVASFRFPFE